MAQAAFLPRFDGQCLLPLRASVLEGARSIVDYKCKNGDAAGSVSCLASSRGKIKKRNVCLGFTQISVFDTLIYRLSAFAIHEMIAMAPGSQASPATA